MKLEDSVSSIKGVGPETVKKLTALKIITINDLLDYWPRRYEDYSLIVDIKNAVPGKITIKARISRVETHRSRRGLHITTALATDNTGSLYLRWFNQPYRSASIKSSAVYYISGVFDLNAQRLEMVNPAIQEIDKDISRLILAVYRETKGINSALLRKIIKPALMATRYIPETLPKWVVDEAKLVSLGEAVATLHLPKSTKELDRAKERLSFEELFELQLAGIISRSEINKEKSVAIPFQKSEAVNFIKNLDFQLTDDQRRAVWQIYQDINRSSPMNRLLEGDVGSGKTVVAAMASLMVVRAGYQVLYMAPTEILARQQAETLSQVFAHTIWRDQIGLLVGSLKSTQKQALHKRVADGSCRLVVGTHALIQDAVATDNVALVVIDEQHRFGVDQRQKLRSKAGLFPHVLCMTATPIPRSLALTLYGELDLSIIKDKPPGRKPVETKIIQHSARYSLYQDIDREIEKGRQVFVVCPLINESDALQAKAVEELYTELKDKLLKKRRIGIVHGSMKSDDKEAIMKDFSSGSIDVLVATTVIEVGVNVPNASVMIIEGAERFGLAQIHQLRGRVGRANHQSYCYLVPSIGVGLTKRLRAVENISDGFKLAEIDLELRGPGAIYGTRQSGLLDLRMANLNDREQVSRARSFAEKFMTSGEDLIKYPKLNRQIANFQSLQKLN